MPSPTQHRRALVRELIASYDVPSQGALGELLAARGIAADQSTLSRDLREIGVVKTATGYALPEALGPVIAPPDIAAAARQWLVGATPAQNLVVLRTPPGGAQALAVALDGAQHPAIVGTIAGDDTVLVVCPDARTARALAGELTAIDTEASAR
ncbi:MAG: arginine repressor [Planctomycetota bacterium]